MAYKGRFKPHNPQKYKGNPTNIIYRSLWELRFMRYLDQHNDVIEWSSEEIIIPYKSPIDNRYHRYFPDFYVKMKDQNNQINTMLVEIKPRNQVKEPVKKDGKVTKRYLNEVFTFGINSAKWKAAEEFCKQRSWQFKILTENELGVGKG
jgi:hypothetical protein